MIIVNGLPGTGKTTLAKRLGQDIHLPVFSRDGIYETLFDALDCNTHGLPPLLGTASFGLLYDIARSLLAASQALIIEGFFGRPEVRTDEFASIQHRFDYEPFQILCKADGNVLLERFLVRARSGARHVGHADLAWLEQNQERLVHGVLAPLALGGHIVEIDTTTPNSFDYHALLQQIRSVLA